MSFTTTVTWASIDDKQSNPEFATERNAKMDSMTATGQLLKINTSRNTATGSIEFNTMLDAEEWKTFIQGLATKYNKSILSITIE